MTETANKNVLQRFQELVENSTEQERETLWIILSAVRGPDSPRDDWRLKSWTWYARNAISPKLFKDNQQRRKVEPNPNESEADFEYRVAGEILLNNPRAPRHFIVHISRALYAIANLDKKVTVNE